jgi:hypothetical protein
MSEPHRELPLAAPDNLPDGTLLAELERRLQPRLRQTPITGGEMSGPVDETPRHPSGTLAIVVVYGVLFALGWAAVYLFVFLQRGHVSP